MRGAGRFGVRRAVSYTHLDVYKRQVSLNGKPSSGADYADDDEARRRAEREFNLSTTATLRDDNKVTAGKFWEGSVPASPEPVSYTHLDVYKRQV